MPSDVLPSSHPILSQTTRNPICWRRARLLALLLAAGCSGDGGLDSYQLTQVDGLPSTAEFQYQAWEQPDRILIHTSAAMYALEPGAFQVEHLFDINQAGPWVNNLLELGPHERVPLLTGGAGGSERYSRYNFATGEISDLAPLPVLGESPLRTYLVHPEGDLLYVEAGVQVYDDAADSWKEVVGPEAQLSRATVWEGQVVAVSGESLVAIDGTGLTTLATCSEDCSDLNQVSFHHPSNGELWLQFNWRWWSYDGEELVSIGPFPNPGAETGSAEFITQVMTTVVLGERIFTVNKGRSSDTEGTLLSWSPGDSEHYRHGDRKVVGNFAGNKDAGIVLTDFTRGGLVYRLHP